MKALRLLASFGALQAAWFASVLGAAEGHGWLGPAVILPLLAFHLARQPRGKVGVEAWLLVCASVIGFLLDTGFLHLGVLQIRGARVSPAWLVALWPNMAAATAPRGSLAALGRKPWLAALAGAIAAPISYEAGARLGALSLPPGSAWVVLSIAWAPVLPLLFVLRTELARIQLELRFVR